MLRSTDQEGFAKTKTKFKRAASLDTWKGDEEKFDG
jgi:hypothetical protein